MSNLITVRTDARFNLPAEQLDDLYGRLKTLFECLPQNRLVTGNAKYKVAAEKKVRMPDWWTA